MTAWNDSVEIYVCKHFGWENTLLTATNNVTVLSQKLKYKEKFDKEMKGKRPQYDLKNSKIYQTLKDANDLASEVL